MAPLVVATHPEYGSDGGCNVGPVDEEGGVGLAEAVVPVKVAALAAVRGVVVEPAKRDVVSAPLVLFTVAAKEGGLTMDVVTFRSEVALPKVTAGFGVAATRALAAVFAVGTSSGLAAVGILTPLELDVTTSGALLPAKDAVIVVAILSVGGSVCVTDSFSWTDLTVVRASDTAEDVWADLDSGAEVDGMLPGVDVSSDSTVAFTVDMFATAGPAVTSRRVGVGDRVLLTAAEPLLVAELFAALGAKVVAFPPRPGVLLVLVASAVIADDETGGVVR